MRLCILNGLGEAGEWGAGHRNNHRSRYRVAKPRKPGQGGQTRGLSHTNFTAKQRSILRIFWRLLVF